MAHDSDEFSRVTEKFTKAWCRQKGRCPAVNFVFKVTNDTLEQKWMTYKSTVREKDIKELYHGTKLACKITTSWKLCNIVNCGICGISCSGLDPQCISRDGFQRFGPGFYLAPDSSKCHDYTQVYNGFRAMLLCDVLPGRRFVVETNRQHLQGPPTGYDSVYGKVGEDLNYPELVVYKPEAVLPRYIIIYRSRD